MSNFGSKNQNCSACKANQPAAAAKQNETKTRQEVVVAKSKVPVPVSSKELLQGFNFLTTATNSSRSSGGREFDFGKAAAAAVPLKSDDSANKGNNRGLSIGFCLGGVVFT